MTHEINNIVVTSKINAHLSPHCCHVNPHKTKFAYADTGASDNYAPPDAPLLNRTITTMPITVGMPNGQQLESTHKGDLQLNKPKDALSTHIIPGLKTTLISIGKLCDAGLTATFNKEEMIVTNAN